MGKSRLQTHRKAAFSKMCGDAGTKTAVVPVRTGAAIKKRKDDTSLFVVAVDNLGTLPDIVKQRLSPKIVRKRVMMKSRCALQLPQVLSIALALLQTPEPRKIS